MKRASFFADGGIANVVYGIGAWRSMQEASICIAVILKKEARTQETEGQRKQIGKRRKTVCTCVRNRPRALNTIFEIIYLYFFPGKHVT